MKKRCTLCFKIICVILFLLAGGCVHEIVKIEEYDYPLVKTDVDGLTIGVRFLGTWHEDENKATLGAPYKLLVWAESATEVADGFKILELRVEDDDSNIKFLKTDLPEKQIEFSPLDSIYSADYDFMIEELDYVDYNLTLKFEINNENQVTTKELKIKMTRKYNKRHSTKSWERLMGI